MQLVHGNDYLTDNSVPKAKQISEASATYTAEARFTTQMPTRTFTLAEAQTWLEKVCEIEDIDPIIISRQHLPRTIIAAARFDDWSIVVPSNKVSQHTLLHELAHFLCANKNHGTEFRTELVALQRRHTSLIHATTLHQIFVDYKLSVSTTLPL
jgi:hypothetical protein